MLRSFLEQAKADLPVYITDVRNAFNEKGDRPFSIHLQLYNSAVRVFPLRLPRTRDEEEDMFVADYIYAMIYNLISSLGGLQMDIYLDTEDEKACTLAASLDRVFGTDAKKPLRSGYGKCLNVNERILRTLTGKEARFTFHIHDQHEEPIVCDFAASWGNRMDFAAVPDLVKDKMLLGIDVGGTDIKLSASVRGVLVLCKEFDWYPAGFIRVGQMIDPIMQLIRLMRDACSLVSTGESELLRTDPVISLSLTKDATFEEMDRGIREMEEILGDRAENFDAVGLSFPDVVIRNLITGGECNKFKGMRDNPDLDFEEQYAEVTSLGERIKQYIRPAGCVRIINDGPMAAFTAAVELAAAGEDVSRGFFAHALGTELGTGWLLPDGTIPEIPLEVYNFIIDLGSFAQRSFDHDDVRSILNFNTYLPGTLQKYTCQSGVFRLAAKYLPEQDPKVYEEAFSRGLFVREGEGIYVPTSPADMRKPALAFFMEKASESSHPACAAIFREIGACLAVTWQETDYILQPQAKDRFLFGRLVKVPACFALMDEGARERVPGLRLHPADNTLANTALMKQLDADEHYTVAQFAQAVGAICFGCTGL